MHCVTNGPNSQVASYVTNGLNSQVASFLLPLLHLMVHVQTSTRCAQRPSLLQQLYCGRSHQVVQN